MLTPDAPVATSAPDNAASRARADVPRLADGVDLIGEALGSGFKTTPYLARRSDGQTLQLTKLLHLVAEEIDGQRDYDGVARAVTPRFGRRVSARNVKTLVEDKLRPLGVVAAANGEQPVLTKPDPLLGLKMRKGVLPARLVKALTTLCYPLFFPPVVIVALVAIAAMDYWVFVEHGVAQGVRETMMNPALFFGMLGLVVASAFFHECGHATGCRYSGAEPGVMGVGVYIVFPAFYTDVTDAYRLGKAGKLRTDLGGVYFNGLFMLATFGVYAATGFEPLLFLLLVQHIEIAHQFLPFLRLDGYYVVADLVGVPDLFSRIGPILKSFLPGREPDPKVTALKPWVRVAVTAWVLLVVPFLLFQLFLLLLHLPRMIGTGAESMGKQWDTISAATADGNLLGVGAGALQVIALALPLLGLAYTLARVGQRASARAWTWSAESVVRRVALVSVVAIAGVLLVRAWLPGGDRYRPIQPGERGTFLTAVNDASAVIRGVPAGTTDPSGPAPETTTPAPSSSSGTGAVDPAVSPSAGPTTAPVTGGTGTSASPAASTGPSPAQTATEQASPSPSQGTTSPSAEPSPSPSPTP